MSLLGKSELRHPVSLILSFGLKGVLSLGSAGETMMSDAKQIEAASQIRFSAFITTS